MAALEEYPAMTLDSVVSSKTASDSTVKLDDVGDALHHALDEVLCGSSQFKQLVPDSSFHINRTVAIAVFPDTTYWVVLSAVLKAPQHPQLRGGRRPCRWPQTSAKKNFLENYT